MGAKSAGEAGAYFAWGEVQADKDSYDCATYRWMAVGKFGYKLTKYVTEDGTVYSREDWYDSTGAFIGDGKTNLEPSDDAAAVNWGGKWRMPTQAEIQELNDNCTWTWKEENEYATCSLAGYLVTGRNGNSIFLPAAGYRRGSDICELGSAARPWSSNLNPDYSGEACGLFFQSEISSWIGADERYYGSSVRAVLSAAGKNRKVEEKSETKQSDGEASRQKKEDLLVRICKESEAVDLGLPSGTLWAPWNVGAKSAGEAGAYFAWGEVQADKDSYDCATYCWMAVGKFGYKPTKYVTEDGKGVRGEDWYDSTGAFIGDGKTTLEKSDEAADVNWGGKWRMPTQAEIQELNDNCTWTWKEENEYATGSLAGYLVTGPNGNSIFLPAAGFRQGSDLFQLGMGGYYWSSELNSRSSLTALDLAIYPDKRYVSYGCDRYRGQSVRAVLSAAE